MDVIGVGYPVQDMSVRVDRIPEAKKVILSNVLSISHQGGGMVSTGLTAASILGAEAGIIGVVGNDPNGMACRKDLDMNGVDTSHLITDPNGSTDFTIVLSEATTNERYFIGKRGNLEPVREEDLDEEYIASAKYLLVTVMDPMTIRAASIAKAHGVEVVIDADIFDQRTMDHMDLIDVFICSEEFYLGVFNDDNYIDHMKEIQAMGPHIALVTLGSRGCAGIYDDTRICEGAYTVEVMDTCGAGDVFHGAFIYAMLKGYAPEFTVRFASAVSAIKCTRQGGRAGIPDAENTLHFMETGEIDYTKIDARVKLYETGLL